MSDDEQRDEIDLMLRRWYDLKKSITCLDNRRCRFAEQLKKAHELMEGSARLGHKEVEIPSHEEATQVLHELAKLTDEREQLQRRLGLDG